MSTHDHPVLKKIRHLREASGYSQVQMAERLNMSPSAYHRHECGEAKPDLDFLLAVTKDLNADLLELLAGDQVVVNNHDQQGGSSGCYNVVHLNGVTEDVLKAITDQHSVVLREVQVMNARLLAVIEQFARQAG
ncbi:MAG: helix-turn-helix transcriptional regulator [Flavobacteriales bacterium]|nr:helix-turn-helix transcriptional regulator [Flavobacteriales bacterium]